MSKGANKGRFKPGQSGNLAGRPKVAIEVKELAGVHTADAINTLAELMNDTSVDAKTRVSAAIALLDRAHGKPAVSVELNGSLAHFMGEEIVKVTSARQVEPEDGE